MAKARYIDSPETKESPEVKQAYVAIKCLGCGHPHVLTIKKIPGYDGPCWEFNNNLDLPTFTPSLLCRAGKAAYDANEWEKLEQEHKEFLEKRSSVCHSFIREGKIQYLSDCTHSLRGQTIDLPEYPIVSTLG